jgi:hypothetical protein
MPGTKRYTTAHQGHRAGSLGAVETQGFLDTFAGAAPLIAPTGKILRKEPPPPWQTRKACPPCNLYDINLTAKGQCLAPSGEALPPITASLCETERHDAELGQLRNCSTQVRQWQAVIGWFLRRPLNHPLPHAIHENAFFAKSCRHPSYLRALRRGT